MTKQTHCHCCRPLDGADHSACGKSAPNAADMTALNSIKIELPARKTRKAGA